MMASVHEKYYTHNTICPSCSRYILMGEWLQNYVALHGSGVFVIECLECGDKFEMKLHRQVVMSDIKRVRRYTQTTFFKEDIKYVEGSKKNEN